MFKVRNAVVDLTNAMDKARSSILKFKGKIARLFLSEFDNFMYRWPTLFLVNIGARVNNT